MTQNNDPKNQNKPISDDNNNDKPFDPTDDAADFIGDPTGLTGITVDNSKDQPNNAVNLSKKPHSGDDANTQDDPSKIVGSMSSRKFDESNHQSDLGDFKAAGTRILPTDNDSDTMNTAIPPSVDGEQEVGGDMMSSDVDDNALDLAHEMGVGLEEDPEHPQELDLGSDVDKAEEYLRTH